MKKSVLFLTAALSFGVAGAHGAVTTTTAQAPALTDVPAGHWAKDAVDRLVGEGIILGFPDGTYRGTQNLTRYEAAMIIARLLDQVGQGTVVVGDLDDATLTSVRNAINELSAELAALDVRVSDLENSAVSREDFARLEGRVDAIAATDAGKTAEQLAAINEMATLLNQDVLELTDRVTAVDGQLVSFDERLGVVENQVVENTVNIDAQGIRIGNLENGRVKLTLGVSGGYGRLKLLHGETNFDVDRLTNGTFAGQKDAEVFSDNDGDVKKVDTNQNATFSPKITLGVKATNIDAGNSVVVEEAGVDFGFALAELQKSVKLGQKDEKTNVAVVTLNSAEVTGRIGDDARFRAIAATDGVKLRPDVVNPAGKLADEKGFNDYLLPAGGRNGVAAGVALTDVPFKPTLYLGGGYGDKTNLKGPWFSVRAESKVSDNFNAGISFVQHNTTAPLEVGGLPDATAPLAGHTAFGVDAKFVQKKADSDEVLYGLKGTYVASMADVFAASEVSRLAKREPNFSTLWDAREQAALIDGEANFFNLGAKLTARAVSPGFANGRAGMDVSADDSDATPKYTNEVGVRGSVSTRLGLVEVGAFGDTYTNYNDKGWDNRKMGLGAHAGVNLGAFRAVGFGSYATDARGDIGVVDVLSKVNVDTSKETATTKWDEVQGGLRATEVKREDVFKPAKVNGLYEYTSSVGALVTHDGSQQNPLVPNLNLAVADNYFYNSGNNLFSALASYDLKAVENFKVTPFVGYSRYDRKEVNDTALKYGVDVVTEQFNVAFKPSVKASVGGANYTSLANKVTGEGSEIGAKVELGLNEFFSTSTKLKLGYSFHQANGLKKVSSTPAGFAFGTKGVSNMVGSENTQTQGIFTQLSWNDALKFNYGVFFNDADTKNANDKLNIAHGFKVSYGVKF